MINPNDQAFPHSTFTDSAMQGLTKREYFAALAMQGILAAIKGDLVVQLPSLGIASVKCADALIAELNK